MKCPGKPPWADTNSWFQPIFFVDAIVKAWRHPNQSHPTSRSSTALRCPPQTMSSCRATESCCRFSPVGSRSTTGIRRPSSRTYFLPSRRTIARLFSAFITRANREKPASSNCHWPWRSDLQLQFGERGHALGDRLLNSLRLSDDIAKEPSLRLFLQVGRQRPSQVSGRLPIECDLLLRLLCLLSHRHVVSPDGPEFLGDGNLGITLTQSPTNRKRSEMVGKGRLEVALFAQDDTDVVRGGRNSRRRAMIVGIGRSQSFAGGKNFAVVGQRLCAVAVLPIAESDVAVGKSESVAGVDVLRIELDLFFIEPQRRAIFRQTCLEHFHLYEKGPYPFVGVRQAFVALTARIQLG